MAIRSASNATTMTEAGGSPRRLEWQPATITEIVSRTARVKSFFLAPKVPFAFRAGQHVAVRLTAEDGYQAQRNYSIASAPEDRSVIELAVERLEDGEVSTFFHDVAQAGDEIELRGPIGGHFVWEVSNGGPLLLVAGGSGIVPLISMLRHRARTGAAVEAALLSGARHWSDIVFREELERLAGAANGFDLVFALSRDTVRRSGDYARRIDAPMAADVLARLTAPPRHVFVCGSNGFVDAATKALESCGIDPRRIFTERFGS